LLADDDDRERSICDLRKVAETEQHNDDDRVCEDAVQYNGPEHGSWDGVTGLSNFFRHVDGAIETCFGLALPSEILENSIRTNETPSWCHETKIEANEWIRPARISILLEEDEVGSVPW
jgi:hypothetical protein